VRIKIILKKRRKEGKGGKSFCKHEYHRKELKRV